MKITLIYSFAYLISLTLSFQGLLGAIYRNFKFSAGKAPIKHYQGMRAVIWGIIFFVGFLFIPIIILSETLTYYPDLIFAIRYYGLLTVASIFIAFYSRKHGIWSLK